MPEIDGVEAHERWEQPPVGFGRGIADQVAVPVQAAFQIVKGREQRVERFLVKLLAAPEAAFVNAVVEGVVDAVVEGSISVRLAAG